MTKYFNLVVAIVSRYEGQVDEENKTEMHFTQQSSGNNACKGIKEGPVQG